MALQVIDNDVCDSIRLVLGEVEETLPNDAIENPALGGAAEFRVLSRVGPPTYAERPAAEQERIRLAVIYLTASLIVAARRRSFARTSEQFSSQYRYTASQINVEDWIADLEGQAWDALGDLLPDEPEDDEVVHFGLARGRRGK